MSEEIKPEVKPIIERVKALEEKTDKHKSKKARFPRAKISNGKLKKNWISIWVIDENRNIHGEKIQIEDSTYRLKDGTYHAFDGNEILFFKGKPVLLQPAIKLNPIDLITGKNETRGQKLIMARMLKDAIKVKDKRGGIGGIIAILAVVGVVGFILLKYVFKII